MKLVGMQEWLVGAVIDPSGKGEEIRRTIRSGESFTAEQRLEVYTRSFYGRLIKCLQSEYPVLRRVMGDVLFEQFAGAYFRVYPPQSYTLNMLGEQFPQFLYESRPEESHGGWEQFLVELAHLERLCIEVYHGPGAEFTEAREDEVLESVSTRTMLSHFPLREFMTQARDSDGDLEVPEPRMCRIAVFRRNYKVHMLEF
ncbi:putative DNA-binding domain-containing protein [Rubritalea tangerina]|uniref:DNA-binding domain-containing protein n=2 Tax=Rubritalea tangerina TaxID=430798 RepID=A0ABW4ZEP4_9BACT